MASSNFEEVLFLQSIARMHGELVYARKVFLFSEMRGEGRGYPPPPSAREAGFMSSYLESTA